MEFSARATLGHLGALFSRTYRPQDMAGIFGTRTLSTHRQLSSLAFLLMEEIPDGRNQRPKRNDRER
jgi:hypothetical protein